MLKAFDTGSKEGIKSAGRRALQSGARSALSEYAGNSVRPINTSRPVQMRTMASIENSPVTPQTPRTPGGSKTLPSTGLSTPSDSPQQQGFKDLQKNIGWLFDPLGEGIKYEYEFAKNAKTKYDTWLDEYKKEMARNLKIIKDDEDKKKNNKDVGYRNSGQSSEYNNLFDQEDEKEDDDDEDDDEED